MNCLSSIDKIIDTYLKVKDNIDILECFDMNKDSTQKELWI